MLPAGVKARIRGMQTHKQQAAQGEPGSRLAINVSGVGTEEINRGDVVVRPGTLQPTDLVDVSFRLLAGAPKPLRHNDRGELLHGSVGDAGAGSTSGPGEARAG